MKPTITINPTLSYVGQDNILTGLDYAPTGVLWSGTASASLNGQPVNLLAAKDFGVTISQPPEGLAATTIANGAWSLHTVIPTGITGGPDGVYTMTAEAGDWRNPTTVATETIVVAINETPFEAVGLAFIDAESNLGTTPLKAALHADFTAQEAGLQTLLKYGNLPTAPYHALIKDIDAEIRILDFTPKLPTAVADAGTVAKLDGRMAGVAAYVHDTPSLVALMPHNIGW